VTFDDFLAIWLALTIAVGYLLLVGLWWLYATNRGERPRSLAVR
jgi:hypothetical protein